MTRRPTLTLAALLATIALAACTGGPPESRDAPEPGEPRTITYLIEQPEEPENQAEIEQDMARFEASTGITVELEVLPNAQMRTVLQTQLRSGSGPDVFAYDTGPGFAGVLAEGGMLYDLTDVHASRDWPTYDWAKQRVTFHGRVLGVPDQVEQVGIFYNKDLFAQHGISEPRNLADLDAAAATLKAAGVTPFAFGDQEGWPGGHLLSMALSSSVGSQGVRDLVEGRRSWSSPEVVGAIRTFFDDFRRKGYLPESPSAISYDNANALFYSGKAAMNPTGTWLAGDVAGSTDFDVGFIPFPGPDSPGVFASGVGTGMFVSAQADDPEAAIQLLDWMQTQEHGKWQIEQLNTVPAFPVDTSRIEVDPLIEQVLDGTSAMSSGTGDVGLNIDVLTPDLFNEAMESGLQSALTDSMTPQEVADSLQAAFVKAGES